MVDAMGFSQITHQNTPFLSNLSEKAIFGRLTPLLSFRGIEPTLFSGQHAEIHGIWTDFQYSPVHSEFQWTKNPFMTGFQDIFLDKIKNLTLRKILTAPICHLTKKIYGFSQFPRTTLIPWNELHKFAFAMPKRIDQEGALGRVKTLFDIFRTNKISHEIVNFPNVHGDSDTMKAVMKILGNNTRRDFYFIRFFDLDGVQHRTGTRSRQTRECLRKTDAQVKYVMQGFEKMLKNPSFIVFSDHGMTNVTQALPVQPILKALRKKHGSKFDSFLDSILWRFFVRDTRVIGEITEELSNLKGGHVLSSDELQEYHLNFSPEMRDRNGNLIFLADKGTLLTPNYYQGKNFIKGMHGYPVKNSELDPFFLCQDGQNTSTKNEEHREFIDFVPTILKLMSLQNELKIPGKPFN